MTKFLSVLVALAAAAVCSGRTVLGGVGLTVASIEKTEAFYTEVFGYERTGKIDMADLREAILQLPGNGTGSALVLMEYRTPRSIVNRPIKLALYVDNVKTTVDKARSMKVAIVSEPGSVKVNNRTLPTAFIKDPDGYTIELNPTSSLGVKFN